MTHTNISMADYLAWPAQHSSSLKDYRKSPRFFEGRYITKTIPPLEPTDAMKLGSMVHLLTLEPQNFKRRFVMQPEEIKVRRGKKWEEFKIESGSREILRFKEFVLAGDIAKALGNNKIAMGLLRDYDGENELSFKWLHDCGLECKARFDRVTSIEGIPAVVDMKIWQASANQLAIDRQFRNLDTHCQRAFYRMAYRRMTGENCTDVLIVVHSEPPHEVNIVTPSIEYLKLGHMENERCLKEIAYRFEVGDWSTFAEDVRDDIKQLIPPPWEAKRLDAEWTAELERSFNQ